MGDWCGYQYKLTENQAVRNNGRELEGQTRPCWCWGSSQQKKEFLFNGEVFFLLTRPLMGDPFMLDFYDLKFLIYDEDFRS